MNQAYKSAGVDLQKAAAIKHRIGRIAKQTFGANWVAPLGGFGGVIESSPQSDQLLVASTDGVGTKVRIHSRLQNWELSGWDIVNHCVNDILPAGAMPLFFLDYIGMGKYDAQIAEQLVRGVAGACQKAGCALIGGETAALPGFYSEGDYDLVGFIVGTVKRERLLKPKQTVIAGDVVLAVPSSGLHTNGYSLVRDIFKIDDSPARLGEKFDDTSLTLGEALSKPHRSYLAPLKPVLGTIKGLAHITGGGIYKNIPRVLPDELAVHINTASWEVPPLFKHIQRTGGLGKTEMFEVFNMGLGMLVIADSAEADELLRRIPDSWIAGKVTTRADDAQVVLDSWDD